MQRQVFVLGMDGVPKSWVASATIAQPDLGYSILDWNTLLVSRLFGINDFIRRKTPKYPRVLTVDRILVELFSLL